MQLKGAKQIFCLEQKYNECLMKIKFNFVLFLHFVYKTLGAREAMFNNLYEQ